MTVAAVMLSTLKMNKSKLDSKICSAHAGKIDMGQGCIHGGPDIQIGAVPTGATARIPSISMVIKAFSFSFTRSCIRQRKVT